jgi:hypothetical protein
MPPQEQYVALLARARKRFKQAEEAERDTRSESLVDLEFLSGSQWLPKVKMERERGPSPRPCLVFNKVLPPVTQLGNQARQNKPAIRVSPVDSAGDPDTAKVLQGMVRHIEYDSDADQAYDTALFYAAGCGFGYWRYNCEYADDESFDQVIKTITVEDPFSIYLDCNARKPDRSDMKWAFVIDKMSNDTFEDRFGEDVSDLSGDFLGELEDEGWRDDTSKRVAEYWEIDTVEKTLRTRRDLDGTLHKQYMEDLEDGQEEEIDPESGELLLQWVEDEKTGQPRERKVHIPRVMQYITNGAAVLEEPTEWDGSTIPIVIVTGLEMVVRGKRKIFSMTRFARDPQQLFNYYKTMEAETISLAPKPKWVGAVGQFRTKRNDWARANTDNAAYLEYDPIEVGGKQVGEPQWRTFDPPVQALTVGSMAAAEDIKATTGYFDPNLGKSDNNAQSGVAIGKLQAQGDVSNFHFLDNLARGLKRGGRILVELIPKKYDTAREVRAIGDDQKERIEKVNQPFIDQDGKQRFYQLGVGKYDVRVDQGPSQLTARFETRELLMSLAQGNPEIWTMAADVFFENSDFVGADRLVKRFHAALPPAILAAEQDGDKEIPPALQAKMQQLTGQNEELTQTNEQLIKMVKERLAEAQERSASAERIATAANESKERIANENNVLKMETALALSKSTAMNALAALDHDALQAELTRRHELLHAGLTVEADFAAAEQGRAHEKEMADREAQQAQQSQGLDQAHEQGMAAADQEHEASQAAVTQEHETEQADLDREAAIAQQESAQEATAEQAAQAQAAALKAAKLKPAAKPAAKKK